MPSTAHVSVSSSPPTKSGAKLDKKYAEKAAKENLMVWGFGQGDCSFCHYCGKPGKSVGEMYQCAKCREAYYCLYRCLQRDALCHFDYCNTGKARSQLGKDHTNEDAAKDLSLLMPTKKQQKKHKHKHKHKHSRKKKSKSKNNNNDAQDHMAQDAENPKNGDGDGQKGDKEDDEDDEEDLLEFALSLSAKKSIVDDEETTGDMKVFSRLRKADEDNEDDGGYDEEDDDDDLLEFALSLSSSANKKDVSSSNDAAADVGPHEDDNEGGDGIERALTNEKDGVQPEGVLASDGKHNEDTKEDKAGSSSLSTNYYNNKDGGNNKVSGAVGEGQSTPPVCCTCCNIL